MTVYYEDVTAVIDPEQFDPVDGGGRFQDVSVILTDNDPDRPPERPAAIALTPAEHASSRSTCSSSPSRPTR